MSGVSAMKGMGGMEGAPGTPPSEHAEHGKHHGSKLTGPDAFIAIDRMAATVAPLNLPNPVLISPPSQTDGNWTAKHLALVVRSACVPLQEAQRPD